jgi:lipopolysaccharide export system protein LptA
MIAKLLRGLFVFAACVFCVAAKAQQPVQDTSKKQINIIRAEKLSNLKKDSTELLSLVGNTLVQQDNTLFYCDSAVLDKKANMLEAFGHVHINDHDSVHTYSDYLRYTGKDKKAYLNGNVKLTDGKGTLTTPDLNYDLNTETGVYTKGGKLVNGKTVLTSQEGYYYGETRDVYFKKKVVLVDPDYNIKTDTLLYNTYSNIATFIVPTTITAKGNRRILTSDGYYDLQNKKAYFGKRPDIQDGSTFLRANEVANDDSTHFFEARGNVVYRDTAQGVSILSNNLKSNTLTKSFLATQNPVMIIKQDADSIFIAADTLYSSKLSILRTSRDVPVITDSVLALNSTDSTKADSANRYIEAYYHVRIFSDSLQAVCDSLFYSAQDSAFRLFKKPIAWAQSSQITGDTIYLYTGDKKPKRMYVFENALTINKVGDNYYNQVKGRTINAYFKDGNIDHMRAKGNAESVYYTQDELKKFISVNKVNADIIDMYFEDKKPNRIALRSSVTGTAYPMNQIDHDELKLRGFKWQEALRPKTKYELFGQ